jgi:hypothetical protein
VGQLWDFTKCLQAEEDEEDEEDEEEVGGGKAQVLARSAASHCAHTATASPQRGA